MGDESRNAALLTWHPGSILPYASLWHTLQRVGALNFVRPTDVPGRGSLPWETDRKSWTLAPLFNRHVGVETDALAQSLGEVPSVFRWSHFGALPGWLQPVVTPGFRICMDCIAHGYHSALLSLRLLDRCPIHGTPLQSMCACERPFGDRLNSADFRRAGCCACFGFAVFTRETCRRPTLDPALTHAFLPIVEWLEAMTAVIKSASRRRRQTGAENATWLGELFQASCALGIAAPDCFTQPTVARPRRLTHSESGRLEKRASRSAAAGLTATAKTVTPSYWPRTPAVHTYRALSRYMRRHVVRHCEWRSVSLVTPTGKPRPELLRGASTQSQQAFAEVLWASHLEPWVHLRRWPYRKPSARPDIVFSEAACNVTPDHHAGAAGALMPADATWLACHAAASKILLLWRAAVRQTQELSQMPVAAVGLLELATLDSFDWSSRKLPDGSLRFISLQAGEPAFTALPLPSKPARIKAFHAARLRTHNEVTQACCGPCLTWSVTDGWHVTASATPQLGDWRRHKLLGVEGQKPHFWLFPWCGLFAARLCSGRLQVFSTTSAGAIQALRKCVAFSDRTLGPMRHELVEQVLPCLTSGKESGRC